MQVHRWVHRCVRRWVRAWVRDGCDPRVSDGCAGEEMGEHTHAPISDDDDTDADLMGESRVKENQELSSQGAIRGLSVHQQQAVELLASGKRPSEVAEALGAQLVQITTDYMVAVAVVVALVVSLLD